MEKYKAIAEKITYSLDGYIADHNNRNFGDADLWLRHVRNRWEQFIEAHPDSHNFHEYLQYQQAKVEELERIIKLRDQQLTEETGLSTKYVAKCAELQKQLSEYIFVAETLDEMYVKEVQKSDELQEEFAEDERFLKEQIKDKDLKISNLEYQQGMDKELIQTLQCKVEKLQKQIDALEKSYFVLARIKSIASKNLLESILIKEVRQALKGEG